MPEISLEQAILMARQLLAQRRPDEAVRCLEQIVHAQPQHAEAWNALGEILMATGQGQRAAQAFAEALRLQPNFPRALSNLGAALAGLGQSQEALATFGRLVALKPDYAEGHASMGSLLAHLGRHQEAVGRFIQALRLKPALTDVHYHLGNALLALGRDAEAEACFRTSLQLLPAHADTRNSLGAVLQKRGALDEAQKCFADALGLNPDFAEAHANLGGALEAQGRFAEALACHQRAVELQPQNPEIVFRLGYTLAALARHAQAVDVFSRVLALQPNHGNTWNNLGISLRMLGRIDDAVEAFKRAAQSKGDEVEAWSNLGIVLDLKGERADALKCYRHAIEINPNDPASYNNLLYSLHFHPEIVPNALLEEHRQWDRRLALPLRSQILPHANTRAPERRLRIGYVSPDFRDHPVGRFMLPLIAAHDASAVEVFCYADVPVFDRLAREIAGRCHHWRVLNGMNDAQTAALIRQDQIDVLVDLTMHMAGNRLLTFARKPAPVQVTYLAYCSTTGLGTMDYRLTDPHLDPPQSDMSIYSEKTVWLPQYWCYAPGVDAPPANDLPARGGGEITFGCLNAFNKVSDDALATWGHLLLTVPASRLLLHANPGSHRERVWQLLAGMGVARQRCEFVGITRLEDYFPLYHRIDIGLDPFPYAGGTTTCDALWMGVPMVTLRGQRAVGRGGVSILSTLGVPQWIAATQEEYVATAAGLAGDMGRLAEWRGSLRERMRQSPLMDAAGFARSIEGAFRQMWREYCGRGAF